MKPNFDSLNLATTVRWIAQIPFHQIDPDLTNEDVTFNIFSCNTPEISLGSNTVDFQGVPFEIPNGTKEGSKEIVFEYIMSSDWSQYLLLWDWAHKFVKENGAGATEELSMEFAVPLHLYILSEFKKPIFQITYNNCWIKTFGEINLNYQDTEADEIIHSFSVVYTDLEMQAITGDE